MYNIIEQHQNQSTGGNASVMMLTLNETKSSPVLTTTSGGFKIDCAKECPCGVPVIPVPDQWLEVMVTGGFKVWHIIFIIIAFLVTIVVVYCCFHRCRIPRTKQEIEADLMRTNLTTKFRDYLQEFPNEPTTFLDALKKVQELEEKWANEQDDTGVKKRMGWLKLRGKDRQTDKGASVADATNEPSGEPPSTGGKEDVPASVEPIQVAEPDQPQQTDKVEQIQDQPQEGTAKIADSSGDKKSKDLKVSKMALKQASKDGKITKADALLGQKDLTAPKKPLDDLRSAKMVHISAKATTADKERRSSKVEPEPKTVVSSTKSLRAKGEKVERQAAKQKVDSGSVERGSVIIPAHDQDDLGATVQAAAAVASVSATSPSRPPKVRRKRNKPNLSRTKAAHVGESIETNTNILTIPVAKHRRHHQHSHAGQQDRQPSSPPPEAKPSHRDTARSSKPHSSRPSKLMVTKGDSTIIQITSDLPPDQN